MRVIRGKNNQNFHEEGINIIELHPSQPLALSGDLSGRVCYCNYNTGEIGGTLA